MRITHSFMIGLLTNATTSWIRSTSMRSFWVASALLGLRLARPRGASKGLYNRLSGFFPHCICKALCDVKTADALAFVDSGHIAAVPGLTNTFEVKLQWKLQHTLSLTGGNLISPPCLDEANHGKNNKSETHDTSDSFGIGCQLIFNLFSWN